MPATPSRFPSVLALALAAVVASMPAAARESGQGDEAARDSGSVPDKKAAPSLVRETPVAHGPVDRSGRRRIGVASVYAPRFAGRKMADGARMDPQDDNAASKTLPLGTEAQVTNLETGRSARVTIQDRGPYVKGRIVDLSPSTARRIGITPRKGVAKVEVAPIALPPPPGR